MVSLLIASPVLFPINPHHMFIPLTSGSLMAHVEQRKSQASDLYPKTLQRVALPDLCSATEDGFEQVPENGLQTT